MSKHYGQEALDETRETERTETTTNGAETSLCQGRGVLTALAVPGQPHLGLIPPQPRSTKPGA